MTYVLGLSAFMDDPSAALLEDGKIVAICEEERCVRAKHGVSRFNTVSITNNQVITGLADCEVRHFPVRSIDFCLQKAGIKLTDIDYFALGFDFPSILTDGARYAKACGHLPASMVGMRISAFQDYVNFLRKLSQKAKFRFFGHHLAHTYGAIFSSDYERTVSLTLDGMGDFESGMLSCYHKGELEVLRRISLPDSIGRVYSSVTNFIGFQANNDEEKVMALGAYGKDAFAEEFNNLVKVSHGGLRIENIVFWNKDCGMGYTNESTLHRYFGRKRKQSRSFPAKRYRDIARSLQETLFRVSDSLLEEGLNSTGYKQLCMSGGIALNCENNGSLAITHGLVDVHVQPQAGDSGIALGAAYACHFTETGKRPESMKHVYYGPFYDDEEIRATLESAKVEYRKASDLFGEISESLARGRIVGWYQGAGEAGPRALGNRSILASPSQEGIDKRVNMIKGRELWRPLAPTILDGYADDYFDYYIYTPFMTLALPLSSKGRVHLRSAKHVNETTRPQTLRRNTNPKYYDLISGFAKLTGTPAVLNTSFNVANEPIVDTPKQALADFATTALDVLVLGDYVVTKRASS